MKAVLIGGSGLIGGYLISYLLAEPSFSQIISITRKPLEVYKSRNRYSEIIFDFKDWNQLAELLKPYQLSPLDAAFCALGTTIKKAGSQEVFYKVDHDYVLQFAEILRAQGLGHFYLVSAMGSNPSSLIFYNKVKGRVEEDLSKLGFQSLNIFRPSLLLGPRQETRVGEKLATELLPFYSPLLAGPLKKFHPIQAERVAKKMVHQSLEKNEGIQIYDNQDLLN